MAAIRFPSGFAEFMRLMLIQDHPWHKTRGYIHFDLPIGIKQAELIVTSPKRIQEHSFYPFIAYEIKSKKIRKDKYDHSLKKKKKLRQILYASHIDSHIYSYYAYMLNGLYEKYIKKVGIESNVLAFRRLGKSNIDFANHAFNEIIEREYCAVIALDVKGFFDNLDHSVLKKSWCEVLETKKLPDDHYKVFGSITKFSEVDKNRLYESFGISKNNPKNKNKRICEPKQFREVVRKNGMINVNKKQKRIPQGSPISALLSNVYMITFDQVISDLMREINGCYLRYCDDILCIVPLGRKKEIHERLNDEIKKLKLTINEEKTKISTYRLIDGQQRCDKPIQYLGFTFDGHHKLIRSAALAKFSERMKFGVRLAKLTKTKYNRARIIKGQSREELYKRKLYRRYSHLGKRNFIRYGFRSAETMNSNAIKKQLKPLWARLQEEIAK